MSYIIYNPETEQYVGTIATYTKDVNDAFRFATKEQAETALCKACEIIREAKAPAHTPIAPQPAKAVISEPKRKDKHSRQKTALSEIEWKRPGKERATEDEPIKTIKPPKAKAKAKAKVSSAKDFMLNLLNQKVS